MTAFFDERRHYEAKLDNDPATVFWGSPQAAGKRYAAILRHVPFHGASILDVGCGAADLLAAAVAAGTHPSHYCGIDIVPAFIDTARSRWPDARFILGNALESLAEATPTDWVIANGLFGHAQPDGLWPQRFTEMTEAMWRVAKTGIAYTLISTHSPRRNPQAHYVDPAWALSDAASRFSSCHILDHTYLPNDMLIVVRKV